MPLFYFPPATQNNWFFPASIKPPRPSPPLSHCPLSNPHDQHLHRRRRHRHRSHRRCPPPPPEQLSPSPLCSLLQVYRYSHSLLADDPFFRIQMSLAATESPQHSSSGDDFAAFLDEELDYTSDTLPDEEDKDEGDMGRIKRRKVEVQEGVKDSVSCSTSQLDAPQSLEASVMDICKHIGFFSGMCVICGQKVDVAEYESVPLRYIHKEVSFVADEIARVGAKELKNLLPRKKLYLVLDLDHTLLNSTRLVDVTPDEEYLKSQIDSLQAKDIPRGSLFRLDFMNMLTKLRPYVRTFLKEASNLFEMYIYTMGERSYAKQMAHLLDPEKVYFTSGVIAQDDSTQKYQKGLDVVLGQESAVIILDDTESVWSKHKENLILMERYNFFASSCRQFGFNCKSLSELKSDESETDGALASILKALKQIHSMFFDPDLGPNLADRDVRQVLKAVRRSILNGCTIVFSRVFPTKFQAENHYLWKIAVQLGAICLTEVDPSVTHVVSTDTGTEKSRWALQEKKFLVQPQWIEATNYFWQKQPEDKFPVSQAKNQ